MAVIIDGYCTIGTERETAQSRQELLRRMDAAGVDRAVIAPDDRELVICNAEGNERILNEAKASGGRLIPACSVNPWRGGEALSLLDTAVGQGARMIVLAPALQGFLPIDDLVDPVAQRAARLAVPLYLHTGPHSAGGPTQAVLLAQRHPATRFILGHCGSTDHAWDMSAIMAHHALPNLWYELGFVRPWVAPAYVKAAGSDRLIFASNAPRNDLRFEFEQFNAALPAAEFPQIYGGNLLRLIEEAPL